MLGEDFLFFFSKHHGQANESHVSIMAKQMKVMCGVYVFSPFSPPFLSVAYHLPSLRASRAVLEPFKVFFIGRSWA